MDSFSSSFLAAVLGFAIGRGIFELIAWGVRKGRVKGAPEKDEGKKREDKS